MLSVAEARARIVAAMVPTAAETVPLGDAWNRVSAAAVVARLTQPPADMSAMDGYALRAADGTLGATLTVVGNAPAGRPFLGTVGPGEAVRIFTGSVVPPGADSILLQEDASRDGDLVTVNEACVVRRHVRAAGQDFFRGDVLVTTGHRLGARDIGLCAAGNHPWLSVHRRPVVGILATGDEITLPGEPITDGGIVSSNAHALAALIRARGGTPIVLPIAADDTATIAGVADALRGLDILVTTGGASVGDHDLVQAALGQRGFGVDFWKIAMRPGKPLMFGDLAGVPVLGLPGNPVSALVCAILFLIPALDRLTGLPGDPLPQIPARLAAAVPANDHRADHLRARIAVGDDASLAVTPFTRQDSALLAALSQADALVVRAPHAPALTAGEAVSIIRLDQLGL